MRLEHGDRCCDMLCGFRTLADETFGFNDGTDILVLLLLFDRPNFFKETSDLLTYLAIFMAQIFILPQDRSVVLLVLV